MSAYDKPAAAQADRVPPASHKASIALARYQEPAGISLAEELIQAVSRGAGVVALAATIGLLSWLVL